MTGLDNFCQDSVIALDSHLLSDDPKWINYGALTVTDSVVFTYSSTANDLTSVVPISDVFSMQDCVQSEPLWTGDGHDIYDGSISYWTHASVLFNKEADS